MKGVINYKKHLFPALLLLSLINLGNLATAQTTANQNKLAEIPNPQCFLTKKKLEQLYSGISGHNISNEERALITKGGGDATYGEITYEGLQTLIDDLHLTSEDVFYDLGCGVGKVATHLYFNTPVKKCIGIELSQTRIDNAQKIKQKLEDAHELNPARTLLFLKENIMSTDLRDASVVYLCSTCYPEKLMRALTTNLIAAKKNIRILTLKQLPKNNTFRLVKTYTLPMTWSKTTTVHLYTRLSNDPEKIVS